MPSLQRMLAAALGAAVGVPAGRHMSASKSTGAEQKAAPTGLGRGVWLPAASWSACSAYRHARTQAVASAGHPSVLTVRS